MTKKVSVLVGSLRKGSFARKTALNVMEMFPEGYEADIVEIGDLPLYNFDYDDPNETEVLLLCPPASLAFRNQLHSL